MEEVAGAPLEPFERTGAGSAKLAPLLLVHGLGESGLCFERLVAHPGFPERRWLLPDMPGYGRSARVRSPGGLADLADYLAGYLEARVAGPAVVIGHSMGGVITQLLAERHPERVAAVVDVDGNLSIGDCTFSSYAVGVSPEKFEQEVFPALLERVRRDGLTDEALSGYHRSLQMCDPSVFREHAVELVGLAGKETLARRLARLPMPHLYVSGVPRGVCARSQELLAEAGASVERVGPSGHWPFIDQPEAFVATLGRILSSKGL